MKCDCANCPTHACYTKGVNCTGVPLERVKDRLLAHNPLGAIYSRYWKRKLDIMDEDEV